MSAPAFTPGPWAIVPYGDERNTNLVIHSDPQNRVCFMATPGQNRAEDEETIEANARLIAAAPELYEALDGALNAGPLYAWVNERDIGREEYDRRVAIVEGAKAALAKATGQ